MSSRHIPSLLALVGICGASFIACGTFGEEATKPDASSGPDTGGPSDDAAGADAASPRDCTGLAITSWSTPEKLGLKGPAGELYFVDPFVSADGLTLLLGHVDGNGWRVFRATRPSRTAPWGAPQLLQGFLAPTYATPYPSTFEASQDEIVAAVPAIHTDMGAITRDGGTWTTTLYGELETPDVEFAPTVTADGTTLVYLQVNAPRPDNQFRDLRQATRGSPSRASAWRGQGGITAGPEGATAMPPGLDWPALTPDGRGLFYTTLAAAHRVAFASRAVRTGSFFDGRTPPVEIEALSSLPPFKTRVRSMTADGCEVYLTSDRGGVLEAWYATRR